MAKIYYANSYAKKAFDKELYISILKDVLETPPDVSPDSMVAAAIQNGGEIVDTQD